MKKIAALYLVWLGRYPIGIEAAIYYGEPDNTVYVIKRERTYQKIHVSEWIGKISTVVYVHHTSSRLDSRIKEEQHERKYKTELFFALSILFGYVPMRSLLLWHKYKHR